MSSFIDKNKSFKNRYEGGVLKHRKSISLEVTNHMWVLKKQFLYFCEMKREKDVDFFFKIW